MNYYFYDKEKLEQGQLFVTRIEQSEFVFNPTEDTQDLVQAEADARAIFDELIAPRENEIRYLSDIPFIGYPIIEGEILRAATRLERVNLGVEVLGEYESIVDGEIVYTEPTMAQKASKLMMTKQEFLLLVIGLTKDTANPITLDAIEAYVDTDPDLRVRFYYTNHIERSHPMLNNVSAGFGVSSDLLDIMFVNKDELIYKLDNGLPLYE